MRNVWQSLSSVAFSGLCPVLGGTFLLSLPQHRVLVFTSPASHLNPRETGTCSRRGLRRPDKVKVGPWLANSIPHQAKTEDNKEHSSQCFRVRVCWTRNFYSSGARQHLEAAEAGTRRGEELRIVFSINSVTCISNWFYLKKSHRWLEVREMGSVA